MECGAIRPHCRIALSTSYSRVSLSGLEEVAHIRAILNVLVGGNAESNAVTAELLTVVAAWPSLSAAARSKILNLVSAATK